MADVKSTSAAATNATTAAPAAAPAAAGNGAAAGSSALAFDDVFDVHPAGAWDTTPFGVAGAWPFASAAALVPPLPGFGSFAFPAFPPLAALPVPVWSATAHAAAAPQIALDLVELPDRFTAIADLPGVHAGDIDLRVDRDARVITVAVVRRRTAHCDCNFVQSCAKPTASAAVTGAAGASAGASAGAKAAADTKAAAPAMAVKACEYTCDSACKAKAVHCRDCEAKGELMGPAAPNTPLVNGCCGYCAGALHLKSKCGRGAGCAASGAGAGVYRRSERQFGRGERSFRVPSDANLGAIASSLRGGVLTITVPRANAKAKGAAAKAADPAAEAKAHAQYETAGHAAAAAAADPKARAAVLQHHVTAPNDNPAVVHARVMRAAAAAGADPRKRAALLPHHLFRADPLSAWQYNSPFAAYSALLPDVMSLAHDFPEVAHHVARPAYDTAAQNPLLLHERVMRQAVAAAHAHAAQAQAHGAAAVQSQAAANAQMAVAASARAAAAEMSAEAAAASAAGTTL